MQISIPKMHMRLVGETMIIGIKDVKKLLAVSVVIFCAVFVCTLFLNYNMDIVAIENEITTIQEKVAYDALVACGKVVVCVSGGCLVITTIVLLIFYIKNYIDNHGKELGILKALGYSNFQIAMRFWIFGLCILFGAAFGYIGASIYMPMFYAAQNKDGFLPQLYPEFHITLPLLLIFLPTIFFTFLIVICAAFQLKKPTIQLLKEIQKIRIIKGKDNISPFSFLMELKRNTLRGRKILIFFIGFSAFCFSAMTQMSIAMNDLESETFSWMILSIGLVLAFTTLFMSLTSVVKSNSKTIAMMKVFGYSKKECSRSILGKYRCISYIGFLIGTTYQYILLKIMVDVVFVNFEGMPDFHFNVKAMIVSLVLFLMTYEIVMYSYSRKIGKQSIKSVFLLP